MRAHSVQDIQISSLTLADTEPHYHHHRHINTRKSTELATSENSREKLRNSAIADKPRDAYIQMQWRG